MVSKTFYSLDDLLHTTLLNMLDFFNEALYVGEHVSF